MPLPGKIANAPKLTLGLAMYWTAFWDLNSCRGGMGGPIPWTAIHDYAARQGIEGEQFDSLVSHVRALDAALHEYEESKRPKPT